MTTDNRTNEPTPEQVLAAAKAIEKIPHIVWNSPTRQDAMTLARAALVAAQGAAPPVGGRPKRLLNQLNRIADALEGYVFEGVAADAPAWMRKAAEYIESERQWRAPVLPTSGVDEVWRGRIVTASFENGTGDLDCGLEECECPEHEQPPIPAGTYVTVRLDKDERVGLTDVEIRVLAGKG